MTNNELRELRKNVTSAMKSFELEGFVYTEEEKRIFNKIANGELSLDEGRAIFMQDLTKKYGTKL